MPSTINGQQELVLVIDNEPAICKVLRMSLEAYGYRVLSAQDGIGAIALLAEHRSEVACVLIDSMMPNMNGPKAIPLLRRINPDVPIVAMTGSISSLVRAELSQLSLQGSLAKPFTTQHLLALLQSILHL